MAKSEDGIHILQGLLVFGNVVIGVSEVGQVWMEASFHMTLLKTAVPSHEISLHV